MKFEGVSGLFSKTGKTLASIAKILLLSKSVSVAGEKNADNGLVILGNGPSLRQTIDNNFEI